MIVKGKYNEAHVYASIVEQEALEQIKGLCDLEWLAGQRIVIMADTHAGAGCTIGSSIMLKDKVNPEWVGCDIGCGMLVVELGDAEVDLKKLDEVINSLVPSGFNIHEAPIVDFDLSGLVAPLEDKDYILRSIGSLGAGNHFIELDTSVDGAKYLVIHTGSRRLGIEILRYYSNLAKKSNYNPKPIIEELKAQGRQKEISSILAQYKALSKPKGYLEGLDYSNYLNDMRIAQNYAKINRETIASIIIKAMGFNPLASWETVHNYIDLDNNILRKGAISAQKGEKILIPINMRDGSLICVGKGNPDYNYTAPHGAGRLLSRTKARETLALEEFEQSMAGIYTTSVDFSTIDEAPMAYKPIDTIKNDIAATVAIVENIKPIYNFKAKEPLD